MGQCPSRQKVVLLLHFWELTPHTLQGHSGHVSTQLNKSFFPGQIWPPKIFFGPVPFCPKSQLDIGTTLATSPGQSVWSIVPGPRHWDIGFQTFCPTWSTGPVPVCPQGLVPCPKSQALGHWLPNVWAQVDRPAVASSWSKWIGQVVQSCPMPCTVGPSVHTGNFLSPRSQLLRVKKWANVPADKKWSCSFIFGN